MKILAIVVCVFLLSAVVAHAQTVSASQSVTLGSGSCTSPDVLAKVKPEYHPRLQKGTGVWFDRKTYELCWLREEGKIIVVWEDGTVQGFNAAVFEAGA